MDFYKFFLYMILFMVLTIALVIFLALSAPLDLWFPSLDPKPAWMKIWQYFTMGLLTIFAAFLVFITIMYIIYFIIQSIPLIGPSIADNLPIFSDMRRAGLFNLIGGSIAALKDGDGFGGKIGGVFKVWFKFMFNSVGFIRATLSNGTTSEQEQVPTGLPDYSQTAEVATETEDNTLTESEQNEVKATYNQCMRENMVPVFATDKNMDRTSKQVQNKGVKTACSIQRMSTYLRLTMANRKLFKN